jgi:hypothetical protein
VPAVFGHENARDHGLGREHTAGTAGASLRRTDLGRCYARCPFNCDDFLEAFDAEGGEGRHNIKSPQQSSAITWTRTSQHGNLRKRSVIRALYSMPSIPLSFRFGRVGEYKRWATEGWHHDEGGVDYVWADRVAKVRINLAYPRSDVILRIDVIPVEAPRIVQELFVFLNGCFVAFWTARKTEEKSARIEANFFTSGENLFTFVSPRAICPAEQGMGPDQRTLGLAFRSLSLSSISENHVIALRR